MILTPSQKFHSNVGDLGKIIVATNFEWLPKVQNITQSGHTDANATKFDSFKNIWLIPVIDCQLKVFLKGHFLHFIGTTIKHVWNGTM